MSVTTQQLYDKTKRILDGEAISENTFIDFLNVVKNKREAERRWQFLMREDSSQTASAGDNYLNMKTLPTDFALDYKIFVGDSLIEYLPTPFEERRFYRDSAKRYYIDFRNGQFALTGTGESGSIYLIYFAFTADVVAIGDTFPTAWPDRFTPILSFDVAAMFRGGVDFDSENARMSSENRFAAKQLYDAMISWNNLLILRSMNHSARPTQINISTHPNVPNISW